MIRLNVFVEGRFDAEWVEIMLVRAFDATDMHISVVPCGGKIKALERLVHEDLSRGLDGVYQKVVNVALVDADATTVGEARNLISRYLPKDSSDDIDRRARIFFTVPTLESWLFADPEVAKKYLWIREQELFQSIDRMVFVDEMPAAKSFALQAFGGNSRLHRVSKNIANDFNLEIAMTRSQSFRDFLFGVSKLIGSDTFLHFPEAGNMLGKRLISSLINETNNKDKIIYRTLDGNTATVAEISKSILAGTELGQQYASDLLRVARDMLEREANDLDDDFDFNYDDGEGR